MTKEISDTASRRSFLKSTVATAALAASTRTAGPSFGVIGANDRIRIACVGLNGKGGSHIRDLSALASKGVEIVALCDVDTEVLQRRVSDFEVKNGARPDAYKDIRKLLEDPSIDAISIATPNHWHALLTIWACQAGKDVYVEKPASHNIFEGRKMVEAARKYNRIVQVGTQARSFPHVLKALEGMREGLIGDIYMTRGLCYKRRDSIGFKEPTAAPENLDFDLWLGPAQKRPFHSNLVHYNWHWFWDFGNGDIGNQGIHELDLARVALGREGVVRVQSTGGRFGYKDQGETANTQVSNFTYEDGAQIVFEVRGRYTNGEEGVQLGNLFYGSEGYLPGANWGGAHDQHPFQDQSKADWKPRFGFSGKPYGGRAEETATIPDIDESYLHHFENWIGAMRSRDHTQLNADILEGHRSAALAHAANLSYRLERTLHFDTKSEVFVGDGAKEANAFLSREYREPFVVPEQV
jgi:predicted dehydrogenase